MYDHVCAVYSSFGPCRLIKVPSWKQCVGPVRPDYGSDVQVRVMQYGPSRQLHRQVVSLHGCKQPHPIWLLMPLGRLVFFGALKWEDRLQCTRIVDLNHTAVERAVFDWKQRRAIFWCLRVWTGLRAALSHAQALGHSDRGDSLEQLNRPRHEAIQKENGG